MKHGNIYKKIIIASIALMLGIGGVFALYSFGITSAHAAINKEINYQGKLTNASNVAVADGLYNMEFKLYTVLTGGSAIFTETLTTTNRVQVTNGLFSVMLGSTTPLTGVDFNQTLYLGVKIEADAEMSPRKIIGAVPAAFVSDTLDNLSSEQFLRSDAQNATSSATTFLNILQTGAGKVAEFFGSASQSVLSILSNGNVGIGTTTPYAALSVNGRGVFNQDISADYFTATSTSVASTFPYASTTALTVAGTNGLQLATGLNGPLQAINGLVSASSTISTFYGGTGISTAPTYGQLLLGNALGGYTLTATSSLGLSSFGYLFPSNATSTLLSFNGGLTSYASSTIGNGTQTGGLTISGGATTTGNAYFAGNVGVGTTSPATTLSVAGNGYFTGGLGVGVLNTTPNTFQVGLCVTGDTLLRRRRKKRLGEKADKSKGESEDADYIYGEVMIKDVSAGDEIQTLDTKTGKLVWSKIKQLAYMGVKGIFSITTMGGKNIRTTANHPYFVRSKDNQAPKQKNTKTLEMDQSIRIEELNEDTIFGIANTEYKTSFRLSKYTKRFLFEMFRLHGMKKHFAPVVFALCAGLTIKKAKFTSQIIVIDFEYTGYEILISQIIAAMGIESDIHWKSIGKNSPAHIVSYFTHKKKIPPAGDITQRDILEILNLDMSMDQDMEGNRKSRGTVTHRVYDDSQSKRPSRMPMLANGRAFVKQIIEEISTAPKRHIISDENGLWTKVINIRVGQEIAVSADNGKEAIWDRVSIIREMKEEDVYDIEVEGTHNFIGNGIVAHNTAFLVNSSGNVGIGTTSPYAALSVAGRGVFNQDVRADYFTATSTSIASTFPYASTTMVTATTASTTNLIISGLGGASTRCLQVNTDGTVAANASACGTGSGGASYDWQQLTDTFGVNALTPTSTIPIWIKSTATSTFAGGIESWAMIGAPYFNATSTTATSVFAGGLSVAGSLGLTVLQNGMVGIGTSSPYAKLSVVGQVVADSFFATSTTATSTFAGGLNVGNGGLVYESATGITSVTGLQLGSMNFDADAGIVPWIDLPISAATVGTVESYIANIGSQPVLTVYGESDGAGSSQNLRVGIGTTTPWRTLSVVGNSDLGSNALAGYFTATSTTASVFPYASTTALTVSGSAFFPGSGIWNSSGFVGIGTTSPYAALSVAGRGVFNQDVRADYFTATSTSVASTFPYASTTALTVSGSAFFPGSGIWNSSGFVGIGTTSPYAALSVVGASGVVADIYTATSTTATSTFAGGLNVGAGNFMYDLSTGVTSAAAFQTGNLNFDTDAGMVSWADLPLSSASSGTIQGYTAFLNGSSTISVYGVSAGSGYLQNDWPRVSIGSTGAGTSTPTSKLTVFGNGTGTGGIFELVDNASTTVFKVLDNGVFTASTTNSANATSTINGNLYVNGTLRSTLSYVGDLIFANNFSFTEAPLGTTTAQGLLLRNQYGKDVFTADENGNLSVVGDVCYKGNQCFGKSLNSLENYVNILASSTAESLFSAQDTTTSSLSGLTVSLSNINQTLNTIVGQQNDVSSSTIRMINQAVSDLTASTTFLANIASSTADTLASSTPSFITRVASAVLDSLKSATDWVFAKITASLAVFDRVETKTAAISQGLEITDQATGQIYCVGIKNGDWSKVPGSCASQQNNQPATTTAVASVPQTIISPPISPATTTSPTTSPTPSTSPATTTSTVSSTTPTTSGTSTTDTQTSTSTSTPTTGSVTTTTTTTDTASSTAPVTSSTSVPNTTTDSTSGTSGSTPTSSVSPTDTTTTTTSSPTTSDTSSTSSGSTNQGTVTTTTTTESAPTTASDTTPPPTTPADSAPVSTTP